MAPTTGSTASAETIGEVDVIASSLEDFLEQALSHRGGQYWLAPGGVSYRHIVYENPPSYWRRLHGDWYSALGDEIGRERCATPDCQRRHILHSVKCRRGGSTGRDENRGAYPKGTADEGHCQEDDAPPGDDDAPAHARRARLKSSRVPA